MKKDILTREDIEILVNAFYEKIRKDELIGFIFTDISHVSWEKHLPVMYNFFENMLFFTGSYTGNPMEIHKHINRLFPLTPAHFMKWILLFNTTVNELFEGKTAELVKQRVKNISTIMQIKIITG